MERSPKPLSSAMVMIGRRDDASASAARAQPGADADIDAGSAGRAGGRRAGNDTCSCPRSPPSALSSSGSPPRRTRSARIASTTRRVSRAGRRGGNAVARRSRRSTALDESQAPVLRSAAATRSRATGLHRATTGRAFGDGGRLGGRKAKPAGRGRGRRDLAELRPHED